jgi:hypothetical protein
VDSQVEEVDMGAVVAEDMVEVPVEEQVDMG